jgi:hypothetical protein
MRRKPSLLLWYASWWVAVVLVVSGAVVFLADPGSYGRVASGLSGVGSLIIVLRALLGQPDAAPQFPWQRARR